MRSRVVVAVALATLTIGGLVWFLLADPGSTPPTAPIAREIAAGVVSTQPAPWSDEAMGGPLKRISLGLLLWAPWPILGAWAQHQRGGTPRFGFFVGLLFGPLGLLVANYSGGRKCPACRANVGDRKATVCRHCRERLPAI